MEPKTLRALKGSIRKWERIVAGTGEDKGPDNCPLCKLFWWQQDHCNGCPVYAKTGERCCDGTPWVDWDDHHYPGLPRKADSPFMRRIARAELRFLKSLLPKPHST